MDETIKELLDIVKKFSPKEEKKKKFNWFTVLWIGYGAWMIYMSVNFFISKNYEAGGMVLIALMWFVFWCLEVKLVEASQRNNSSSLAGWSSTLVNYGESVQKNMKLRVEVNGQKETIATKNSEIAELLKQIDTLKKGKKK